MSPVVLERTIEAHDESIWAVAFDASGRIVVSGSGDTTLRFWSTETGEPLGRCVGHESRIYGVACHPRLPLVLSASRDGCLKLWSLEDASEQASFEGHEGSVYHAASKSQRRMVPSLPALGSGTLGSRQRGCRACGRACGRRTR
jgi:WD40 repeat protein